MFKRLGLVLSTVALLSGSALLAVASPAGALSATTGSPQQNYVYGLYGDLLLGPPCVFQSTWSWAPLNAGPVNFLACNVRTPDTTGLGYYTAQLGLATTTIPPTAAAMTSVVNQIVGSGEYRNDLVTWAYACYLGRPGDAAGIAYYDALKGVTFNSLTVAMLASNELFTDTANSPYGGSSPYSGLSTLCGQTQLQYNVSSGGPATSAPNGNFDTWLNDVYSVLLGRSLDTAGKAYYDAQYVKGVSLASIVTSILNSTEYETNQVSNFYTHFLRRNFVTTPDATGVGYWVAQMKNGAGLTPEQVMAGILSTSEYWAFTQSASNQ